MFGGGGGSTARSQASSRGRVIAPEQRKQLAWRAAGSGAPSLLGQRHAYHHGIFSSTRSS